MIAGLGRAIKCLPHSGSTVPVDADPKAVLIGRERQSRRFYASPAALL